MLSMKDLTQRLFKKNNFFRNGANRELKELVDTFKSFQTDVRNILSIENITTTIFSKRVFRDFYEEERYKRLQIQILQFIYENLRDNRIDPQKEKFLLDFLLYAVQKPGISGTRKNLLITFNYDLLLEDFLKKNQSELNLWIDYGVKLRYYLSYPERKKDSDLVPFQLLKLHGSFNWFQAKGSSDANINSIYQVDPDDENFFIHQNDVPVFIPMIHAKELFLKGTLYNTLWVKAAYYLEQAQELYFIGYGFPATDINNLLFFGKYRDKIKKIVVYYEEDRENEIMRLQQLFGPDRVISCDAITFLRNNYLSFS
ncbi:MAG: SIR2 family protein [Candidatus Cloacimonetes bacterium]|nr:SIR2 family protein [Candidatus Cloacimonadota bacterium]